MRNGGHFETGGHDGVPSHEYDWHTGAWMDFKGDRHEELNLEQSLIDVDWVIVHVTDEGGSTEYRTVYGPFDDFEEIEDVIEYYFGPDYGDGD